MSVDCSEAALPIAWRLSPDSFFNIVVKYLRLEKVVGNLLFPRLPLWQQRRQIKLLFVTIFVAAIVSSGMTALIIFMYSKR